MWNWFVQLLSLQRGLTLDQDINVYYTLNAALFDASIAAWTQKRLSVGYRPLSAVRQCRLGPLEKILKPFQVCSFFWFLVFSSLYCSRVIEYRSRIMGKRIHCNLSPGFAVTRCHPSGSCWTGFGWQTCAEVAFCLLAKTYPPLCRCR
jgi:hypothetical protein